MAIAAVILRCRLSCRDVILHESHSVNAFRQLYYAKLSPFAQSKWDRRRRHRGLSATWQYLLLLLDVGVLGMIN